MAEMNVPYNRRYTDAVVNSIIRRARDTQGVIAALGDDAPAMPKYTAAQYVAETTELQSESVAVNDLLTQLIVKLKNIDNISEGLKKRNESFLPLLRGAVMGTANENLLEQIMGAAKRGPKDPIVPPTA